MTQLAQVYTAVEHGYQTSPEISLVTGLSTKRCSSHLSELLSMGVVRKTGLYQRSGVRQWHRAYCYEIGKES